MKLDSLANAHAEWIAFVQNEIGFSIYKRGAFDRRNDFVSGDGNVAFKHAADDAFLSPCLAFFQLSIGIETSHLRAGAGTARRTVVAFAGAQNKVLAVHAFQV